MGPWVLGWFGGVTGSLTDGFYSFESLLGLSAPRDLSVSCVTILYPLPSSLENRALENCKGFLIPPPPLLDPMMFTSSCPVHFPSMFPIHPAALQFHQICLTSFLLQADWSLPRGTCHLDPFSAFPPSLHHSTSLFSPKPVVRRVSFGASMLGFESQLCCPHTLPYALHASASPVADWEWEYFLLCRTVGRLYG